jgi:hypothetical protein
MAFDRDRWTRVSLADNTGAITLDDASVVNGPAFFTYKNASDTLATIEAANYFSAAAYDLAIGDFLMVTGSDGNSIEVVSAVDRSANPATVSVTAYAISGGISTTLPSGDILVGSALNVATDVTMSGDATIIADGTLTIAAGAIDNAKVDAAAGIVFSKLETLASGELIVGSAGGVPTAVAMSGDVAIIASGATTIQAGAVDSSMMNANMLRYATVTMSAAEFNGAYVTPHLLVAAAGADTMLVLESAQVLMTYGTTQFANGGVAHIQYDSTTLGAGIIASSTQAAANFFDAADTALGFNQGTVKQPFATAINKGLYFSNVTGAFDTGDSTFVVHVWYRTIPSV